ncbi:THAP domain-containing protein 1 [Nymphon striatum]|nr:THAP domain-containing protein 1 [Nymphon striatum]
MWMPQLISSISIQVVKRQLQDCVVRVPYGPYDTKVKRKTIQMAEKFQPVSSDLTLKERKKARSLRSVDLSDAEIGDRHKMVYKCAAFGCRSGYKGETADRILSFHKFPLKDPELIQRWLRRLQRKNFVPTENSRLCSLHFDDSSFVLQTTDKNKKRAGARDFSQLSKRINLSLMILRRLVINAVPSIFPNCPSYMKSEFTNECSASRGKSATTEGRQDRMNSQLQENIQNFWSEDSIKSIEDVYQKLEAQSGYIPIGFTWILQSEKLLILSIVWNDGVPRIVGSITLCSSLSISITVNGGIVAPQKFKHITSKEKLENFDTLRNLMAAVKNWIVISETDCSELLDKAKDSLEKYMDKCEGIEKQKQCGFLREQIGLLESSKKSRRYSPDCLISSYLLYAASPNAYEEFRKQNLLCLPSSRTLRSLTSIIKANESKYLKSRFSNLNSYERHVILMIDEIYTASRVEYSSSEGKIIGLTTDNNVAGTILTFMISSIAGQYRDVVSFYPINGINAKKLHVSCLEVLKYLDEIGFNVTVLCVDNHPVNRAFLTNILCNGSLKSQIKNPVNDKPLFLLFDPVHNIKNVYNNFQGKRIFKLPSFHLDNLNFVTTAKFDDLCELHNLEATKPIKLGYKLTEKCLNPTSIEKSSVKLSMSVFNESTENALRFYSDHENKDWIGTATFISHFLKLWSIINVKNKSVGKFKRDPYREPITTVTDGRLTYLYDFANFLKRWQQNKKFCLTKETFTVMHHMCVTLPQIACYFLDVLKFQYVLFGKFQSDMIESRFGWYRQLSGGNYFISVKQVLESERKIKAVSLLKFSGLNALDDFDKHDCVQLSENEVECFVLQMQDYEMAKLDSGDMNAIYYVAGALVRSMLKRTNCVSCKIFLVDDKRSNIDELAADKFEIVNDDVKHFVEAVNRGGLLAPSSLAFDISVKSYSLFFQIQNNPNLLQSFLSVSNHKQFFRSVFTKFYFEYYPGTGKNSHGKSWERLRKGTEGYGKSSKSVKVPVKALEGIALGAPLAMGLLAGVANPGQAALGAANTVNGLTFNPALGGGNVIPLVLNPGTGRRRRSAQEGRPTKILQKIIFVVMCYFIVDVTAFTSDSPSGVENEQYVVYNSEYGYDFDRKDGHHQEKDDSGYDFDRKDGYHQEKDNSGYDFDRKDGYYHQENHDSRMRFRPGQLAVVGVAIILLVIFAPIMFVVSLAPLMSLFMPTSSVLVAVPNFQQRELRSSLNNELLSRLLNSLPKKVLDLL